MFGLTFEMKPYSCGWDLPEGVGLGAQQLDPDDRLGVLVAVLPGHDDPHWRPVLLQERLAIDPGDDHRQWVHRLVEAQALEIGPGIVPGLADAGHLGRLHRRHETGPKRAVGFGSTRSRSFESGNPDQGTFIAQRSTQRKW